MLLSLLFLLLLLFVTGVLLNVDCSFWCSEERVASFNFFRNLKNFLLLFSRLIRFSSLWI